jgi:ribose transport system permease protein
MTATPPQTAETAGQAVTADRVKRLVRDYAIVWVTIALFVGLAVTTDNFLSTTNLRNILDQQATVLIVASVTTLTVIAGGFDVSLGAIFVVAPLVALRIENLTGSILLAVLAGMAAGAIAGALNGLVVARFKINSFIGTLATSFVFFGAAYIISDKSILRPENMAFREFATTRVLGLTTATWMAAVVVAIAWVTLERTRTGRYVFAAGGNPEAARLSGVRVSRILWTSFAVGGLAAGLAGTIGSAQSLSAQASDDFSFVFAVIAAVVVGGTSIAGGEGAVWRTVVGVFFIALLVNGFNLNGVDPVYQRVIQGLVILAAVAVDSWTRAHRT